MPYQHIAYVSSATKYLSPSELDTLLLDARRHNQEVGVTGVLLCHKTTFFQFFEGLPDDVADVYERIKNSSQHTGIFELVNEACKERYFNNWQMGFCFTPETKIQELAEAQWETNVSSSLKHAEESLAIKMLQEFWRRLSV